jgi:hypothetical protein
MRNHPRFSAASARQQQQRAFAMQYRLTLGRIQSSQEIHEIGKEALQQRKEDLFPLEG